LRDCVCSYGDHGDATAGDEGETARVAADLRRKAQKEKKIGRECTRMNTNLFRCSLARLFT
jgi:hypothetical protein